MKAYLARVIVVPVSAVAILLTLAVASGLVGPRESQANQSYARPYPGWSCTATGGQPCLTCPAKPVVGDDSCLNTGPGAPYVVGACSVQNPNTTCWLWTQYCGGWEVDCATGDRTQTFGGSCNESPNYCTTVAS